MYWYKSYLNNAWGTIYQRIVDVHLETKCMLIYFRIIFWYKKGYKQFNLFQKSSIKNSEVNESKSVLNLWILGTIRNENIFKI